MQKIKINDLKTNIKSVYALAKDKKRYVPMFIWGAPGIGKSAAVKQAADELAIEFIDVRLSLLSPVDLRGLPYLDKEKKKAMWFAPDFLPNGKNSEHGILFLDEMNLAAMSVMSAGYQLVLDRRLGEYVLPKGWIVIAAGNRAEDNSSVTKFPAPLANRFVHYEMQTPTMQEWSSWAMQKGLRSEVIAFLQKLPQHLYTHPKAEERTFCTPRSWEMASNLLDCGSSIDAAVGVAIGTEFALFERIFSKIPNIEDILKGKKVPPVPATELDILYATAVSLVTLCEKDNVGHIDNLVSYMRTMPKDMQMMTIGLLKRSTGDEMTMARLIGVQSSEGAKWREENKDVFSMNEKAKEELHDK